MDDASFAGGLKGSAIAGVREVVAVSLEPAPIAAKPTTGQAEALMLRGRRF